MKHQHKALILAGLAATLLLTGLGYTDEPQPTAKPEEAPAVDCMEVLESTQITIKFQEVPLSDAFEYLKQVTELNFFLNWRAIEATGIARDTPVSIDIEQVSAKTALELVLQNVANENDPLDYMIGDNMVRISSKESTIRETQTRVYDIRDLFGGKSPDQASSVINIIKETIDPFSWRPEGNSGSIRYLSGNLVITQTANNHRQIAVLLDKLRAVNTKFIIPTETQAEENKSRVQLVDNMKAVCADSDAMNIIAIGSLRSEAGLSREQLIETLEALLADANRLSTRNAIRLTLKDLYLEAGNQDKVVEQLKAIIKENNHPMRPSAK